MPVIVFYEINEIWRQTGMHSDLAEIEGVIFDFIIEQEAASAKGVYRHSRNHGHSQADTSHALGQLINKGVITRRNITVEHDEVQ